jgi:hypothetical protein
MDEQRFLFHLDGPTRSSSLAPIAAVLQFGYSFLVRVRSAKSNSRYLDACETPCAAGRSSASDKQESSPTDNGVVSVTLNANNYRPRIDLGIDLDRLFH